MYLHRASHDDSGGVTHTHLHPMQITNMDKLVQIDEIDATTLDDFYFNECEDLYDHQFLVKIDVDGNDDEIIKGGFNCIARASFVVTEMSLSETQKFTNRIATLNSLGFRIYDICDVGYYFGQASQIDMVFINEAVRKEYKCFQPWNLSDKLVWSRWEKGMPGGKDTYTVDFSGYDK